MHFGLEGFLGLALYISLIAATLLSVFWRPITGIYYLAALIPLQTLRYHLNAYPLGGSMVGIIIVAVAVGILRRRPGRSCCSFISSSLSYRSAWARFTWTDLYLSQATRDSAYGRTT
jgi:hypothetical protein